MYTCDSQCNTCNYNKLLFHLSCVINIIFYNLLHVNNYNNTLHFVPCSRAFISRIICYQNAANPLKLRIFILYLYCSLYYSYFFFLVHLILHVELFFFFFSKLGLYFIFAAYSGTWYTQYNIFLEALVSIQVRCCYRSYDGNGWFFHRVGIQLNSNGRIFTRIFGRRPLKLSSGLLIFASSNHQENNARKECQDRNTTNHPKKYTHVNAVFFISRTRSIVGSSGGHIFLVNFLLHRLGSLIRYNARH